jgi:hypothetical protein
MKNPFHAPMGWVWLLWVFCLIPSAMHAQEQKDSIDGHVYQLDDVTVNARRMPAKSSSATPCRYSERKT